MDLVELDKTRDGTLLPSYTGNDYAQQANYDDHEEDQERLIQRYSSCPPYLRVSRWNVTKVRAKQKVLNAAKKINSIRSPSLKKPSISGIQDDDGHPVVLVGPVIGLVTTSTARILVEIDKAAAIKMVLQPLDDQSAHSTRASGNHSSMRRNSSAGSYSSHHHQLQQGGSTKSILSRVPYSSVAGEETADVVMPHDHLADLASEDAAARSPLITINGQHEDSNTQMRAKGFPRWLKQRKSPNLTFHQASSYDSPHPAYERKRSGSLREASFKMISKLSRRASLYRNISIESSNASSKGSPESSEPEIIVTKKLKAKRPCVFEFTGLQPGTRYLVNLRNCHASVKKSSFKTFPEEPLKYFQLAAISCNSIFITKKTITKISDLWFHLFKSIREERIDLIIHLGDQIYGDGDRHLDAGAGKNRDKWSNRFKIGLDILKHVPKDLWITKKELICEKYREVYRETWKHPHTANCLARCPNLMIYDDHEIRDNWGDNKSDWSRENESFFVARCAWIVTMEYQRQLYEDVDFSNLEEINKDYHFHVIGKVGLMFLDIRGSRTFHREQGDPKPYLGSRQWDDIKHALGRDGLFNDVQVLVVCSPAPLVFLIPSITTVLGQTVHRLEDFKGHWSHHNKEQIEMIDHLSAWKSARSAREVIVLGGDVHCGGHSCIMKSDETLFYQLTTSAIANMPLPKSAYYFMRLAEQLEHIKEGIKFRHFGWTRSRNYGLIQVKLPAEEDEDGSPEVITQLVKGKFLRHVKFGRKVSNKLRDAYPTCTAMKPISRELTSIIFRACDECSVPSNQCTRASIQHKA